MSFAAIEARGGTVERVEHAHGASLRLPGVVLVLTDAASTTYTVTLPKAPTPQLVFTRESLRATLAKLLWPELVLGDAGFDDVVVARTTTPAATRAFLHDAEARAFVIGLVAADGALSVDGNLVTVHVPEASGLSAVDVAAFVERLI